MLTMLALLCVPCDTDTKHTLRISRSAICRNCDTYALTYFAHLALEDLKVRQVLARRMVEEHGAQRALDRPPDGRDRARRVGRGELGEPSRERE